MESDFDSDERSYRRGLILGLTMAEVLILVLFALLLAWTIGLGRARAKEQQVRVLAERVTELEEQRNTLLGGSVQSNQFDDLFRELRLAKNQLSKLKEKVAALEDAERLQRELTAAGFSNEDVKKFVEGTLPELQASERRVKTLEGRLRNAERQLVAGGRGTEKPACWADSSGRPEYIFDVALKTNSLKIHDNALPHRRDDQAKLPLQGTTFGHDVTAQEFREMTRPLFLSSEKEGCRFFVRVFDLTEAHEKSIYKFKLRIVGEHFYYYEELTRPWKDESAITGR